MVINHTPGSVFILETSRCKNLTGVLTPVVVLKVLKGSSASSLMWAYSVHRQVDLRVPGYSAKLILKCPSLPSSSHFLKYKASGLCREPKHSFGHVFKNKPRDRHEEEVPRAGRTYSRNQGCPSWGTEMVERLFHQEVFCGKPFSNLEHCCGPGVSSEPRGQTRASPWGLWTGSASSAWKAILVADGHKGARTRTRKVSPFSKVLCLLILGHPQKNLVKHSEKGNEVISLLKMAY